MLCRILLISAAVIDLDTTAGVTESSIWRAGEKGNSWSISMLITILAKSSESDPYEVDFFFKEGKLTVRCSCKAGFYGKLCRHKTALIAGDQSMLFQDNDGTKLSDVQKWIEQTNYPNLLEELEDAKFEIEKAKRHAATIKKKIEETMKGNL